MECGQSVLGDSLAKRRPNRDAYVSFADSFVETAAPRDVHRSVAGIRWSSVMRRLAVRVIESQSDVQSCFAGE